MALEVGCGAGDQSLFLASKGYSVSGVDISPTAIEWAIEQAAERGHRIDFRVMDVRDLVGIDDEAFDWVLDGYCWHCVIGEDRGDFLRAVTRVLKPSGIFTAMTLCNHPGIDIGIDYVESERVQVIDGVAARYWGTTEGLLAELAAVGLIVTRYKVEPAIPGKSGEMLVADAVKGTGPNN